MEKTMKSTDTNHSTSNSDSIDKDTANTSKSEIHRHLILPLPKYALILAQLLVGSLVLLLIICTMPLLYILSYIQYQWYVNRRERVIRGLQRRDKKKLKDITKRSSFVQARDKFFTMESLSRRTSMFLNSVKLHEGMFDEDESAIEVEQRLLSNYSGTYEMICNNVKVVKEEEDIVKVIKYAVRNGLCVRAMGSLFSWPNVVEPSKKIEDEDTQQKKEEDPDSDIESDKRDGIVLDMKEYNKLLNVLVLPEDEVQQDGTVAIVRVQSGMKVWQVCELLDDLGYALPVLGNVTGQSVGGVISTGTHGKNIKCGTLSSICQSMTLVLADGSIKNIALRDEQGCYSNDPLACAAGVSCGLLGVISTVALRVVPKHRLKFSISSLPFDEFLESYDEIVKNSEHAAFIYFPYVDHVRVEVAKKLVDKEETTLKYRSMPKHNRVKLFFASLLNYILFESKFGHWFGPVVWLIIRYITLIDLEPQASVKKPAVDKSYKVVANNVNFDIEHHEMEYGYDAGQAKEVIQAYRKVYKSLPSHYQYSSMLDIRFSNRDAAWLAASSGQQTVWLDLIRPSVHKHTDDFLASFKPTVLKYKGRPHFGKINILGADELNDCFPHWKDFIKIRNELDPSKVFANPYFESLFGSKNSNYLSLSTSTQPNISRSRQTVIMSNMLPSPFVTSVKC